MVKHHDGLTYKIRELDDDAYITLLLLNRTICQSHRDSYHWRIPFKNMHLWLLTGGREKCNCAKCLEKMEKLQNICFEKDDILLER